MFKKLLVEVFLWTVVACFVSPEHLLSTDTNNYSPNIAESYSFSQISATAPGRAQAVKKLAKGKLLVATKELHDFFFSQTVIFLISYDWDGAMGVIINRPTTIKLSEVLPHIRSLQKRDDLVFIGGPVAGDQMLLLIQSARKYEEATHVLEDIYISSSPALLEKLAKNTGKKTRIRAYAGYAGWTAGQLEQEVLRGDWYILSDKDAVFKDNPHKIWPQLIEKSTVRWTLLDSDKQKLLPVEIF